MTVQGLAVSYLQVGDKMQVCIQERVANLMAYQ